MDMSATTEEIVGNDVVYAVCAEAVQLKSPGE
jgi:hypothetical protein